MRELLPDGTVRVAAEGCEFRFRRLRPGVVLTTVSGFDRGQLGDEALDEIGAELRRYPPITWFLDAREVAGVSTSVREQWTAWFRANAGSLRTVAVLVGENAFMNLTVSVTQLFSGVKDLHVLTSEKRFEDLLARS